MGRGWTGARQAGRRRRPSLQAAIAGSTLIAMAAGAVPRVAGAETGEAIHPGWDRLARAEEPRAVYDANSYDVIHVESTSVGILWDSTTAWWRPVRGIYRQPASYGDFLRALGRPDLAEREESRHATAQALFWGGLLVMVGGLIGGAYELSKKHDVGAIVGGGLLLGGYVSLRVGSALSRPALPEPDARDLAARYDRALGQHLGLSLERNF